ncbi:Fic family protein [Neisseria sp. 83E34]|uniref:Fic family protein n=1 Tax=Neisseria sp. 83E34 TaxID=1692264 RepID=UPI0006CE6C32|nr:Fic family protein [Neisseria sp. 83E34]KPN70902.1 Fic family protein [Neisseria sp. 83E34]
MKPPFSITNHILNLIVEISHIIGRLQFQYERNLYLRKENRIRSIQSSLAIENNSLTIEQVTDIINGKRVLGNPKEIQEVKNAYDAYEEILNFNPYRIGDFLKAHGLLTEGIVRQAGGFRHKDVGIFAADGTLLHMGARPQFVPDLMEKLFAWAETDDTPMLVKSAVVHYEIEMIHPFEDGNGRMGRLWQSVMLSSWNPLFAWIPVETMVYGNQQGYYRVLTEADKANNSTVFVEFMLDMLLQTLKVYALDATNDVANTQISEKARQAYLPIRRYLEENAEISNSRAQQLTGKSAATVRKYLAELTEAGLLEAVGTGKGRVYRLAKPLK